MKFIINNENWEIEEKSQDEIKEIMKKRGNTLENGCMWFGVTLTDINKIYLCNELHPDRKEKTLCHELMHCYITSNIMHVEKDYSEEELCDIFSNAFVVIGNICSKYFCEGDNDEKKMD